MQGRSRQKKSFEIAPEIQHLANIEELGEFRKIYTIKKSSTQIFDLGAISIFLGPFWIFLVFNATLTPAYPAYPGIPATPATYMPPIWAIPGLIAILAGLYVVLSRKLYPPWHIYLWQYGFLYEKGHNRQVFRWNQIASIHSNPKSTSKLFSCLICRQDGYKLKLNGNFSDINQLLDNLHAEFVRQFGPPELISPPPRNTHTFSETILDHQGLGSGPGALPWQDIQELITSNGTITIVKKEE